MARAEPASGHGWFPDPEEPGRLRMWDGHAWTSLTKYPARDEEPSPAEPRGQGPTTEDAVAQRPRPRPAPALTARNEPAVVAGHESFGTANRYSLATLGVAVIFIVLASAVGLVYLAIVPVALSVRAFGVREPMAPLAALAAAAAVVIGLVLLTR